MRIRDLKLGSIMLVVALWGLSTHSARADSILTQIDMSDTDGGGWTTSANAFEFHLFATSGTNPAAGFLNSGTDVALPAVGLTVGDNVFTLVGNDNSGLESQGTPVITLHFSAVGLWPVRLCAVRHHPGLCLVRQSVLGL